MFIVKLVGVGEGCDYTIGCNNITVTLPESIRTMEEAIRYVCFEESKGSLNYYGIDRIEKATIYEVAKFHEVDVNAIICKQEEILRQEKEAEILAKEKLEFERLKAKLGR